MQDLTQTLEAIAYDRLMAQATVNKCRLIEQLIQQNAILQQDIKRLQEDSKPCQGPPPEAAQEMSN